MILSRSQNTYIHIYNIYKYRDESDRDNQGYHGTTMIIPWLIYHATTTVKLPWYNHGKITMVATLVIYNRTITMVKLPLLPL